MTFVFSDAKREAVPMLVSIAGVSGAGKTYSALLLAAGLAGAGKVAFIDTENKRGKMYADSPGIMAALPKGYTYAEMREPFSPARYIEAIDAAEQSGCKVLVVDSFTHEWEGHGGCTDIAENNKMRGMPNWIKAKLEHKKMMNRLLSSSMHIVLCLRAREKVKVMKNSQGKEEFVQIGLQPIQEKNFTFEMTLSLLLDEHTHRPLITKCPEPLLTLFAGDQSLITKAMGEKLRAWTESAAPIAPTEPGTLQDQALAYASQGSSAYQSFWKALTPKEQKELLPEHEANKELARMADEHHEAESTLLTANA